MQEIPASISHAFCISPPFVEYTLLTLSGVLCFKLSSLLMCSQKGGSSVDVILLLANYFMTVFGLLVRGHYLRIDRNQKKKASTLFLKNYDKVQNFTLSPVNLVKVI